MKRLIVVAMATLLTACGGGSDKEDCERRGGTLVTEGDQTGCVLVNPLPPLPRRQGG